MTISPERSLILICLEISSAASRLVFKAVRMKKRQFGDSSSPMENLI